MPASPLIKLTVGLSRTWAGFLRDWDRSVRAANHPETTRHNFLLAAAQLGRFLAEHSPDSDADDPTVVTRAHVELHQTWMIDTQSASTAVNSTIACSSSLSFCFSRRRTTARRWTASRSRRPRADPGDARRGHPHPARRVQGRRDL